jgi:hypothetical protein
MQDPKEILKKLQTWAKQNPNRTRTAIPIEIRVVSDTQEGDSAPATVAGLVPTPLEPPGPVAHILWVTDPEFRAAGAPVRRTILRDTIVSLTARVDTECRGVKWSRKKVQEQLAAQQTAAVSPPMDTPELDRALAHLYGIQKVVVNEAGKKVRFFPADPRTWSSEFPIWCTTTGARAVLHAPGEEPVGPGLSAWLSAREDEGWTIDWPEADMSLEAIKAEMLKRGIGCGVSLEKPKKADWALALGRADSIRHLASLLT